MRPSRSFGPGRAAMRPPKRSAARATTCGARKGAEVRRRLQMAAVGAALLALPGVASAGKGHGDNGGGGDPKVVASGLDNPRGLAFGPDGALYVTEAGLGGPTCLPIPTAEGDQSCFGTSGAITRVWRGGQERVVEGLPSLGERHGRRGGHGPERHRIRPPLGQGVDRDRLRRRPEPPCGGAQRRGVRDAGEARLAWQRAHDRRPRRVRGRRQPRRWHGGELEPVLRRRRPPRHALRVRRGRQRVS